MKNLSKYKKNISFFCPINKLSGGGGGLPKDLLLLYCIMLKFYIEIFPKSSSISLFLD